MGWTSAFLEVNIPTSTFSKFCGGIINQAIYIRYQNLCLISFMILAQVVLQIFGSPGPLWFKCLRLNRGIIQSNIHRLLRIDNEVIYIIYTNDMPEIIVLA